MNKDEPVKARRGVLRYAAAGSIGLLLPHQAAAAVPALGGTNGPSSLAIDLVRPVTGERCNVVLVDQGRVVLESYQQACRLLRDVEEDVTMPISVSVLGILAYAQLWFAINGQHRVIEVTSGARTRHTNDATPGAAAESFHTKGRAIDWRMPGVPNDYLGRLAQKLGAGGIGLYESFIHVDDGPYRQWTT